MNRRCHRPRLHDAHKRAGRAVAVLLWLLASAACVRSGTPEPVMSGVINYTEEDIGVVQVDGQSIYGAPAHHFTATPFGVFVVKEDFKQRYFLNMQVRWQTREQWQGDHDAWHEVEVQANRPETEQGLPFNRLWVVFHHNGEVSVHPQHTSIENPRFPAVMSHPRRHCIERSLPEETCFTRDPVWDELFATMESLGTDPLQDLPPEMRTR